MRTDVYEAAADASDVNEAADGSVGSAAVDLVLVSRVGFRQGDRLQEWWDVGCRMRGACCVCLGVFRVLDAGGEQRRLETQELCIASLITCSCSS